jgi:putative endonuclease
MIMFLKENIIQVFLRKLVTVAQLVRASDCGSEGRGFETPQSPPLAAVALAKAAIFFKPFPVWYVYILRFANGQMYKGCTIDIDRRFKKHQSGQVHATRKLLPVELVSYITFNDKYRAYAFEKYLKSGSGRAFLIKHFG